MSFRFRPLRSPHVTSPFGERDLDGDGENEDHNGTDYRAPVGTPLYAMGDGIVERADDVDDSANGKNVVIVDDDDGRVTYLHMSDVAVVGGQRVAAGQFIGRSGATGATRGPHLHLQWQPRFPESTRVGDIDPVVRMLPDPPGSDDEHAAGGGFGFFDLLLWAGVGYGVFRGVQALSRRGKK